MKLSTSKIFLVLCLNASLLPLAYAANPIEHTITATGKGDVFIPQTIATFQLMINKTANTAKQAQTDVRIQADGLIKALKAANPISIETVTVNVVPTWSYANNTSKITGYSASYGIQVKSKIADAGKIIDSAMDNGVNNVNNPVLSASAAERSKAQLEAIKLATLDAKQQADASLAALNLRTNGIKDINVQNTSVQPNPAPRYALMRTDATNAAAPATTIEANQDDVQATVSLTLTY
jgi:uncharacterized protein YggE